MKPVHRKLTKYAVIVLISIAITTALAIAVLDITIKPAMNAIAEVRVRYYAVDIINRAIKEVMSEEKSLNSIVNVVTDSDGSVRLVQTDSVAISNIATKVSERAQSMLQELKNIEIAIPLGSLISSGILSGKGPNIHITMLPAGAVSTDFSTEFENAGINQTRHRVYLQVTAQVRIVAPLSGSAIDVKTEVPIMEMVIVGDVPETYINVPSIDNSLDLIP